MIVRLETNNGDVRAQRWKLEPPHPPLPHMVLVSLVRTVRFGPSLEYHVGTPNVIILDP